MLCIVSAAWNTGTLSSATDSKKESLVHVKVATKIRSSPIYNEVH